MLQFKKRTVCKNYYAVCINYALTQPYKRTSLKRSLNTEQKLAVRWKKAKPTPVSNLDASV